MMRRLPVGPQRVGIRSNAWSRQLPGPVVEELADGLEQTYRRYLGQGLAPQAAAEATVAEFGAAELIAAEFSRAPGPPGGPQAAGGRSSGGLLLGPGAGDSVRAWTWPCR